MSKTLPAIAAIAATNSYKLSPAMEPGCGEGIPLSRSEGGENRGLKRHKLAFKGEACWSLKAEPR
jgi:hypothetical protein